MVEAKNFVEKTLGKSLDKDEDIEQGKKSEKKSDSQNTYSIPEYTPPPPLEKEAQMKQVPLVQIVERVVYKKRKVHGFFRTLTIIALLAVGFLMRGESTGILMLSINGFKLNQIFPLFIILSTLIIRSYKGIFGKIFGLILFLTVFGGVFTIGVYTSLKPSSKRKSGDTLRYVFSSTGQNTNTLSLETLIGKSLIVGGGKGQNIQGTRNSDRRLFVSSGASSGASSLDFKEDPNRNVLQNYISNITLTLPKNILFNLLYIKNILGSSVIDLTDLQWESLKFHGGINDITMKIGKVISGSRIEIQGTAANISLDIPKDVGVVMYYKHLVGMLTLKDFNAHTGHYFQSTNLGVAKTTLNISINLGAGNTKINWVNAGSN